jgi:hypothetical protein
MGLWLRIALLLPLVALLGCGAGTASNPTASTSSLNGNWEVSVSGALVNSATVTDFKGALELSGGIVTGTFRVLSSTPFGGNCPSITTDLTATGTLDSSNNLTLTIPLSGGIATINASLPLDTNAFIPGTYQIVGGTCATPLVAMDIIQFPPVTGTYTGTLSSAGSPNATVTAVLAQSTTPNSDGQFPLSGTVTVQGVCSLTMPLAPEVVSGNGISSTSGGFPTSEAAVTGAVIPPLANSIQASVQIYVTNCDGGSGTLTRQ